VFTLLSLRNTSNKGQVSRSLSSQLLKKQLRTATSKCHSKRSVCHSKESVCNNAIHRILLSLCCLCKNMCVNYFYCLGSFCIELSLIVSWARWPTFLIAVNCRARAPTKTHCVWKILNDDETSKAELLLVLQEILLRLGADSDNMLLLA